VGKSTVAPLLADHFSATLLLDPVSASPLLDEYYTDGADTRAELAGELHFLRLRANVLTGAVSNSPRSAIRSASGSDDSEQFAVSDFTVMRTAPFSEFLDEPADREVVLAAMYEAMANAAPPLVTVLLRAGPARLLDRVHQRSRPAETEISVEHLDVLCGHFDRWQSAILAQSSVSLVVDTERHDLRSGRSLARLAAAILSLLDP
jgi:deoxyadenosine/deoxycytidine kinase